jgi:uncharacterized DUF497 family protein
MQFEWDPAKARQNRLRHGVSFELASTAFDDPNLVLADDAAHSVAERRYFAFGSVVDGVITVRFTMRGNRVRIIGAGYWRKGKDFYEEANRVQR